jgi:WD40 repeat protein
VSAGFSPDGRSIALAQGTSARVISTQDGSEQFRISQPDQITEIQFSPDDAWVVTSGSGTHRLWDRATGAEGPVLEVPGTKLDKLAFSRNGRVAAAGSADKTIRAWSTGRWNVVRAIPDSGSSGRVGLNAEGTKVFGVASDGVRVWDLRQSRPPVHLPRLQLSLFERAPVFAPDDGLLSRSDTTVWRWDTLPYVFEAWPTHVVFSPDGRRVVIGEREGASHLWDVVRGSAIAVLGEPGDVAAVAFDARGSTVATGAKDGKVRLWDAASGALRRTLVGHEGPVTCVAFVDDDRVVTGGDDRTLRVWGTASGSGLAKLDHAAPVSTVVVSPDARMVATVCKSKRVHVWNLADSAGVFATSPESSIANPWCQFALGGRRFLITFQGIRDLAWVARAWDVSSWTPVSLPERFLSPPIVMNHGAWLGSASGARGPFTAWELEGGRIVRSLEGCSGDSTAVGEGSMVAVARNRSNRSNFGHSMIPGDPGSLVQIWDAATGAIKSEFETQIDASRLGFEAEDRCVLITGPGGVRAWDATTGAEIGTISRGLGLHLSTTPDCKYFIVVPDTKQQVLRVPVDPAAEARLRNSRVFSMEEVERYEIGTPDMRRRARTLLGAAKFRREIIQDVAREPSLNETVRAAANETARRIPESPFRWGQVAWEVAKDPGKTADELNDALRLAEEAVRLDPTDGDALTVLGVVRYRMENYAGALDALHEARPRFVHLSRAKLAFLAMTLHRLGHADAAEEAITELRTSTSSEPAKLQLLAEAEELMGTPGAASR